MFTKSLISFVLFFVLRCDCNAHYDTRIINGSPVPITDVPFMALYRPKGKGELPYHCGAVIVHERFLISAAHCYKKSIPQYRVTVGTDHALEGGIDYDIEETTIHPNYNEDSFDNDVLVIKIKDKLTFNERVQKIEIVNEGLEIPDTAVMDTMGFGWTDPDDENSYSNQLLKVTLPYIPYNDCKIVFPKLTPTMMCAGGTDKDSCKGDSGGPLTYKNQVVGLVSYGGKVCGQVGVPGVYTNLSEVRDFILKMITFN